MWGNFLLLKKLLTSTPILKIADLKKDFVACINSCIEGLDGVLMQEGYVVYYQLRKLKEHKKRYANPNLEIDTIVHALKMWRQYLLGRRFELRIDHMSLEYLFDQPSLNTKHARWLEFLCEFDFEIDHVKLKESKVADSLSIKFNVVAMSVCKSDL